MGEGSRVDVKPLVIGGRPCFYDVFIARYSSQGLFYGFTELEERFVSKLPIIDFIVDTPGLADHISFMEKLVLDDFFRLPVMIFALIGFYDGDGCGFLDEFISSSTSIDFSTTQWYGWRSRIRLVDKDPFLDFLYSYSRYFPSRFRPEVFNRKFRDIYLPFHYLNAPSFGGWDLVGHGLSKKVFSKPILLPPNLVVRDSKTSHFLRNLLYENKIGDIDVKFRSVSHLRGVDSRLTEVGRRIVSDRLILPLFHLEGDEFIFCFKVLKGGKVYNVVGPVYEDDGFVIDPFFRYRGRKYTIYFSLWNVPLYRKGFSVKINLNFMDYLLTWSRMFFEFRYGGKLIYSSPSLLDVI